MHRLSQHVFLSLLGPRAAYLLGEGGCSPGSALVYDRVISQSGPLDRREEATMKRGFFSGIMAEHLQLKVPDPYQWHNGCAD